MYKDHMPRIRDHGLGSYQGFCDVVQFTLLSVRQPFVRTPDFMKDVRANGKNSRHVWGWKLDGFEALEGSVGRTAYAQIRWAKTAEEAIKALVPIPGLGIVKGGFVAQMLGFPTGCLDSRNEKQFGIGKRAWRYDDDYSATYLKRRIDHYVDTCRDLGGAEFLWDNWCTSIAKDNGDKAERVSAMHLAVISEQVMAVAMCRAAA